MRYQRKYSSPPCSKCGSTNTIVKRYDTGKGSREYICKDCGKCFSIRINPKPQPSMKAVAKTKTKPLPKTATSPLCSLCGKPVCICKEQEEKLEKENEFRENMESALSLDSCLDVPCFLCLEQNRHCTEKCENLEIFLMGASNRD